MIHEIIIVGGGFGGVRIAKILSKWGKDLHITLIDKNHYHTFYPDLYEVATANIEEEYFGHLPINFYDLKSTASFSFEDIFLDDLNVNFVEAEVTGVDFKKQEVSLKNNFSATQLARRYDFLVLGVGSETNYFNIPGLLEHALPLKNLNDALDVRNAIDEAFANLPKNHLIKIVIGGGGFTGCEFAGELPGYLKKLAKAHGRPEYYAECTIIEGTNTLLGGAGTFVQKKALKRLSALGIKMKFNSLIKGIEEKNIILQDASKISFDVLVWTAGVKANELARPMPEVKIQKNLCVTVDPTLRIKPYENIFGVGDATYCIDEATGKSLPMTASVAIREAKYVAENIKRIILKKQPINYKPHRAGFIVPLGGRYALLDSHGFTLSGYFPWLIKQFIALHYFSTLLGWRIAFKHWKQGLKIYVLND